MGIFHVDCVLINHRQENQSVTVDRIMVDSGSEYTWVPETALRRASIEPVKKDVQFVMANGQRITRHVGYAIIRCGEFETIDEIVFGRDEDLRLLGSRTLEGFAATVDARRKKLVAAGPLPVACGLTADVSHTP